MKHELKVNLLSSDVDKLARRNTLMIAAVFTLFVGVLSALGAHASYRVSTRGGNLLTEVGNIFSITELRKLVWDDPAAQGAGDGLKTPDGTLNILLLGIGGEGHDGAQLTDTIILASIDPAKKSIGLLSIPRDLAYPLGGGRFEKINSVNAYNELEHPGEGAKLTAADFAKLLEVRIDRVVRVDFKGFELFIDAMDGVDVNVESSFTDTSFPTDDHGPDPYKWTSVTFKKGVEHMSGSRALTFARSRHAGGGEGSDFARSRRQQIVMKAVRDRLLSVGTLANPKRISDIWTTLSSHVQTDLSVWDALKLSTMATNLSDVDIVSNVLTDAPDGELVSGTVAGAFMLFPKRSDWSEIRTMAANPFESKAKRVTEQRSKGVVIEVKNGTFRTGFASQIATLLGQSGYTVSAFTNAQRRDFEKTVIYDLTNGKKPDELAKLKMLLDANVASLPPSNDILLSDGTKEHVSASSVQFLVILGTSSLSVVDPYASN